MHIGTLLWWLCHNMRIIGVATLHPLGRSGAESQTNLKVRIQAQDTTSCES